MVIEIGKSFKYEWTLLRDYWIELSFKSLFLQTLGWINPIITSWRGCNKILIFITWARGIHQSSWKKSRGIFAITVITYGAPRWVGNAGAAFCKTWYQVPSLQHSIHMFCTRYPTFIPRLWIPETPDGRSRFALFSAEASCSRNLTGLSRSLCANHVRLR